MRSPQTSCLLIKHTGPALQLPAHPLSPGKASTGQLEGEGGEVTGLTPRCLWVLYRATSWQVARCSLSHLCLKRPECRREKVTMKQTKLRSKESKRSLSRTPWQWGRPGLAFQGDTEGGQQEEGEKGFQKGLRGRQMDTHRAPPAMTDTPKSGPLPQQLSLPPHWFL